MRTIVILAVLSASGVARAGAVLSGDGDPRFPTAIDVAVEARAQVETTTMVFTFDPIPAGDYVLTVPGPERAYAIGVDVDRGGGFAQAPMVGEAPPPALGGSAAAGDPTVAAWIGDRPLKADLADLGEGPLTVRVRFQRLLRRYQGEVAFRVGVERSPLRPVSDPGPRVHLSLSLATFRPLLRLDATGTPATIQRAGANATIEADALGEAVLEVRYAEEPAASGIGMNLLWHRTPTSDPLGGPDGYFLLLVDADASLPDVEQARTLSLVIDRSGSMAGAKLAQAKEAARAMLDHLGPADAFNLLAFSEEVGPFRDAPVAATAANLEAARDFIKGLEADGGTNLNEAIVAGLTGVVEPASERFDAMILLSDGLATVGEQDDVRIHQNAVDANRAKARIFAVSVGNDADRLLMEALARSSRGRHYVLNDAEATRVLVARVTELFEDIRVPRLTDLSLELQGVGAADLLPEQMQDLFSGGQAILVGRYRSPAAGTVRISGLEYGLSFSRAIPMEAPALETDLEVIKYVWATEKVGTLLADIARSGDVAALRQQITELGLAYRIQTPFTTFSTEGAGGGGAGGASCGGCSSGAGAAGLLDLLAALGLVGGAVAAARRRRAR